jgi:uncharacterized cupredoxin-like copper-binding protein
MRKLNVRLAAGLAIVCASALVGGTGGASASPAAKVVPPTKITVTLGEFYIKVSKLTVAKPGTVIFTVTNKGTIQHNFVIQKLNKGSRLLNPHQKQVVTIKFTKPGSYYFLCTVPRHAEQGMAGSFIVK